MGGLFAFEALDSMLGAGHDTGGGDSFLLRGEQLLLQLAPLGPPRTAQGPQ